MKKLIALICAISMACSLALSAGSLSVAWSWTYRNVDEVIHGKYGFDTRGNEISHGTDGGGNVIPVDGMNVIVTGTAISQKANNENDTWNRSTETSVKITRVITGDYQVGDTIKVQSGMWTAPPELNRDYVFFLRSSDWEGADGEYWIDMRGFSFVEIDSNGKLLRDWGIWEGVTLDSIEKIATEEFKPASLSDALNILKYLSGSLRFSELDELNYDFDRDGAVTVADALEVLKYLAGLQSVFTDESLLNFPIARGSCKCNTCEYLVIAGRRVCTRVEYIPFSEAEFTNEDVVQIAKLLNVKELSIHNVKKLTDISPLVNMKNLTGLWLGVSENLDLSPIADMIWLRDLSLFGYDENTVTIDISKIAAANTLRFLGVYGLDIADITPLTKMTRLTGLRLHDNDISDISPIGVMTNLQTLWLEFEVDDLSPISSLTNLQTLSLNGDITDISALSSLVNLRILYLWGSVDLDLSPLNSLTNLIKVEANGENYYNEEKPLGERF